MLVLALASAASPPTSCGDIHQRVLGGGVRLQDESLYLRWALSGCVPAVEALGMLGQVSARTALESQPAAVRVWGLVNDVSAEGLDELLWLAATPDLSTLVAESVPPDHPFADLLSPGAAPNECPPYPGSFAHVAHGVRVSVPTVGRLADRVPAGSIVMRDGVPKALLDVEDISAWSERRVYQRDDVAVAFEASGRFAVYPLAGAFEWTLDPSRPGWPPSVPIAWQGSMEEVADAVHVAVTPADGRRPRKPTPGERAVSEVGVSLDGKWLLTRAMGSQVVTLWDLATGARVRQVVVDGDPLCWVGFEPDGTVRLDTCSGHEVRWTRAQKAPEVELPERPKPRGRALCGNGMLR